MTTNPVLEEVASPRAKKIHIVKSVEPFFGEVWSGRKQFEVRRDDRGYQTGDLIVQRRWSKAEGYGRSQPSITHRIGSVLRDFPGLRKGYCAFGLLIPTDEEIDAANEALDAELQS